jgi:proteasome assembly chaperone (PAC2) family protein
MADSDPNQALKDEAARLVAQKAVLDARKGLAEAKTAADIATAQAMIGSITASSITGTVTTKTDAGKGEASLLAARAVVSSAEAVAKRLSETIAKKRIVLMAGTAGPQLANYEQFELRKRLVESALTDALRRSEVVGSPGQRTASDADSVAVGASVGLIVDAAAKLGSYFKSNYEVGGLTLTSDDEQLLSAVAGALLGTVSAVVIPSHAAPAMLDVFSSLDALRVSASSAVARANDFDQRARKLRDEAEAESDAAKKTNSNSVADEYEASAADLRLAVSKADELTASLGVADAQGVLAIVKIAREKAVREAIDRPDTLLLLVSVRSAVGGFYAKQNLWTFLGGMPFYAMGGSIVTYTLLTGTGEVQGSGLIPIHSGYGKVSEIGALLVR